MWPAAAISFNSAVLSVVSCSKAIVRKATVFDVMTHVRLADPVAERPGVDIESRVDLYFSRMAMLQPRAIIVIEAEEADSG